jgi:hypothetical protein
MDVSPVPELAEAWKRQEASLRNSEFTASRLVLSVPEE